MGYSEMDVSPSQRVFREKFAYEKSVSLSSVTVSDWILIPADTENVVVTVVPGSGCSAKVETTTDPVSVVKGGSPTAIAWDNGVVTATTQDFCVPVTAIRLSQTVGTNATKMTLRAQ